MKNFWKAYFALFKDWRWVKWMVGVSFIFSIVWGAVFEWKHGLGVLASYWGWSPVYFYFVEYRRQKPLDIRSKVSKIVHS